MLPAHQYAARPSPSVACGTGVLVLHGSSGRLESARADLLAARGAYALALQWLGGPGQRTTPCEVPIEEFVAALDVLARDCDRIAILGTSFGAEAALVTATVDARVDAVVAVAPTPVVWAGYAEGRGWSSHWTLGGRPLPYVPIDPTWSATTDPPSYRSCYEQSLAVASEAAAAARIEVERIRGEVVLVAGGDDQVWPGAPWAEAIARVRRRAGLPTTVVIDPEAGHRVVLPGEEPVGGGMTMARGGTDEADRRLGAAAWPAIVAALRLSDR